MKDINAWIGTGRLTRDAELKYTNSGLAICSFSIAVNRSVKDGEGWKDEASFFDCTLFGKFGEVMQKHLVKGKAVTAQGELRQERWQQDGQSRSKVVIIVDQLQLGGSPQGRSANENAADYIPF